MFKYLPVLIVFIPGPAKKKIQRAPLSRRPINFRNSLFLSIAPHLAMTVIRFFTVCPGTQSSAALLLRRPPLSIIIICLRGIRLCTDVKRNLYQSMSIFYYTWPLCPCQAPKQSLQQDRKTASAAVPLRILPRPDHTSTRPSPWIPPRCPSPSPDGMPRRRSQAPRQKPSVR